MKFRLLVLVVLSMSLVACGPRSQRAEKTAILNKHRLEQNEIRLHNLETSLAHMQTKVADLDQRTYEVRSSKGRKTGMVVVPVAGQQNLPLASKTASLPAEKSVQKPAPVGRKIDPAAPPVTPPKQAEKMQPKATVVAQKPVAATAPEKKQPEVPLSGPTGQLSAQTLRPDELALPPTDMPGTGSAVPALPPETANATPAVSSTPQGTPATTPPVALPKPAATSAPVAATSPAPAQQQAPVVAKQAKQGEEAAYKAALQLARSGRSAEGIARFEAFLQEYPSGKYAPNAQFWIGECLYSQGKYQEALDRYKTVNDTYPKHHKNADALLKAGMSLSRLGDAQGATQKYQQLKQNFPNSEAARRVK